MTPLFSEENFKLAKYNDKLPLKCLHCGGTFYKSKKKIRDILNPNRPHERGDFCSHACSRTFQGPPVAMHCKQCGNGFNMYPSQAKRSKHHFCCCSCAVKYNNTHKTTGTRVSKLERWLQERLQGLYTDLEFHFNRKDTIDGELDIYIPSLKLAFELNGIFHYEPIYGPEKLASIQSNDGRKFQACLERGIELCIVDTSRMIHFKERRALKYLDVIRRVLEIKCAAESSGLDPQRLTTPLGLANRAAP